MSEENIQSEKTNSASEISTEDGSQRLSPDNNSGLIGRIAEIVGSIILASAAAILFDSGFHRLGDVCMFFAILCGIHLLASLLRRMGFKNVNQWSIAAVIIAAVFLICFAHGPDAVGTKPTDMLSKPDAEEIINKYDDSLPMQQASVASGFNGLAVIWRLQLRKANEDQGLIHLVLFASHSGAATSDIRMDVPKKGNEFLNVANREDYFVVKGNILKVGDTGIDLAPGGTILPAK